ncbi:hypothetical protein A2U01_0074864, partial [Trifolium medium]|nr:hypothetical protein [Trifolium medium]
HTTDAANTQLDVPQPPEVVIEQRNASETLREQIAQSQNVLEHASKTLQTQDSQSQPVPELVAVIKSGLTDADMPQL